MIKAQIIADSVSPAGCRLTTFLIHYPRIVLAELNTHRVMSRNTASSRAIPSKKIIAGIVDDPALPVFWGANQSGMQAAVELDDTVEDQPIEWLDVDDTIVHANVSKRKKAKHLWLKARDLMIGVNQEMQELGFHKQIANRILESWMTVETVLSATEWENFFALRCHKDAQPEIQALADSMLWQYCRNTPKYVPVDTWHLPFSDQLVDPSWSEEEKIKCFVARCARTSYKNFEGEVDLNKDLELCDRLIASGHMSPTEHCARALDQPIRSGNFFGWEQYRKTLPYENRKANLDQLLIERINGGSKYACAFEDQRK